METAEHFTTYQNLHLISIQLYGIQSWTLFQSNVRWNTLIECSKYYQLITFEKQTYLSDDHSEIEAVKDPKIFTREALMNVS